MATGVEAFIVKNEIFILFDGFSYGVGFLVVRRSFCHVVTTARSSQIF